MGGNVMRNSFYSVSSWGVASGRLPRLLRFAFCSAAESAMYITFAHHCHHFAFFCTKFSTVHWLRSPLRTLDAIWCTAARLPSFFSAYQPRSARKRVGRPHEPGLLPCMYIHEYWCIWEFACS